MGFLQTISEFFESIFNRNSPEVQKRLQMKRLETEIMSFQPAIYKNGFLLPNFAEALKILYVNSQPISNLLLDTVCNPDTKKARRFEAQLVMTGFSTEKQNVINSLSYEERVQELENKNMTSSQIFGWQHKKLDKIIAELSGDTFRKIDQNILSLKRLKDLCSANFLTPLQVFDPGFNPLNPSYIPTFQEIDIQRLSDMLEDLYYQTKGLEINMSMANSLTALLMLKSGGNASQSEQKELLNNLKAIAYLLRHIISPEKVKTMIIFCRKDTSYEPKVAVYNDSARKKFEDILKTKFRADEQRIKTEMKDENIRSELSELFGSAPLLTLYGYNSELNAKLVDNAQPSFLWILPMQILKTFIASFFTENIRSLLNDIIVEGFFNNPNYKTEFSSDVYASFEVVQTISNFEAEFSKGGPRSVELIESYLQDGNTNAEFFKKLDQIVESLNAEAIKLIAQMTNVLNKLSKHLNDLLQDAKKPASEIISNLKVLMMSSRNRDNTDMLEKQYGKWEILFRIMKNYVIITN